jgi:hypothetical protein
MMKHFGRLFAEGSKRGNVLLVSDAGEPSEAAPQQCTVAAAAGAGRGPYRRAKQLGWAGFISKLYGRKLTLNS